ncbi:hypothetical protein [Pseudomonas sp. NBRC 111121]|uniref:hypothetical protein n=1 Tax=Pseudomonas sp. NBRC 111121 TaxID=1661036 RepID=UPI0012E2FDCB|nr:hypothetical protein [Pseudomonas sp. NBRC 111121]
MQIKDKNEVLKKFEQVIKENNNHLSQMEKASILIEQINTFKNNQKGNDEKDMESGS